MEHRYHPRVKESLPVSLWHAGKLWGTYSTDNISLEGLFIKTSPMDRQEILSLRRNPLMKICLKHLGVRHCMSAFVVHRSGHGLGLMLAPPDPAYTRWMQEKLNMAGQQTRHDQEHTPSLPIASNGN